MLPIVLVLLVATSALAAPSINLNLIPINEARPLQGNGRLISAALTDKAFEVVDAGELSAYIITAENIINDLANQPNKGSQALAVAQLLAILGSVANGIPGDACAAANLIDAYAFYVSTGNSNGLRSALPGFIQSLVSSIDLIVQLTVDPNVLKFSTGARGNCNGGGRSYQFDAAWNAVLASASPEQVGLLNEQYCTAKKLCSSLGVTSNNAGAAVTAASLPVVNTIFQEALEPVARFLGSVASGNCAANAGAAKSALSRAAARVSL